MIKAGSLTLRKDEAGAALIELALVAPIIGALVIGAIDLSGAYSRKLALEQGAQRAIEKVMQTTELDTVEDTIKKEAAVQANVPTSAVTVTYTLLCNGAAMSNYEDECSPGEREARYLSVEVTGSYRPIFPVRFGTTEADGTYLLKATAGMRTS